MDEAIQAERHSDWIQSIVNQNEAMKIAGDALAKKLDIVLHDHKFNARYANNPHQKHIYTQLAKSLAELLVDWEQAKDMG